MGRRHARDYQTSNEALNEFVFANDLFQKERAYVAYLIFFFLFFSI